LEESNKKEENELNKNKRKRYHRIRKWI
jgi:hypothetical protein